MTPDQQSSPPDGSGQEPIQKAEGVTPTERYLVRLCEKSFLSMWSYPCVYRDKGNPKTGGHGKEICDLLVIFGRHVIIFSDKHCIPQESGNTDRDWRRWFRNAIQNSAEQAWGAERWIRKNPNRIFLDRECKRQLPINLPPVEKAIFHLVVVAHGVSQRIKRVFSSNNGSLRLDSGIKGLDKHTSPFCIGDLSPQKTFVHTLDDDSLQILMSTRDTISDFTAYLWARQQLFRGPHEISTPGEEQLLAVYLKSFNENNQHCFAFPTDPAFPFVKLHLPEGHWEAFQKAPERIAQLMADRVSYAWDKLIEKFSFYALQGKQYYVTDGGIKDTEVVLRLMAREPRWKRRYLAQTIMDMLQTTPDDKRRLVVVPPMDHGDPHYVFLLLPIIPGKPETEYRNVRRLYLEHCCAVAKLEYPKAKDIVGIATECGVNSENRSEDAIYFDARDWNTDMEDWARKLQKELGILMKARRIEQIAQEYPSAPPPSGSVKNPRNKPCPCGSGKKYKHCCL